MVSLEANLFIVGTTTGWLMWILTISLMQLMARNLNSRSSSFIICVSFFGATTIVFTFPGDIVLSILGDQNKVQNVFSAIYTIYYAVFALGVVICFFIAPLKRLCKAISHLSYFLMFSLFSTDSASGYFDWREKIGDALLCRARFFAGASILIGFVLVLLVLSGNLNFAAFSAVLQSLVSALGVVYLMLSLGKLETSFQERE
jgi:hypothetical protein